MTYSDKSLLGKRSYEIKDSVLYAEGSNLTNHAFKVELALADLNPNFERVWIRSPMMIAGLWIMIGGCVGYTLLDKLAAGKAESIEGFCISLAFAGLFVLLVAMRRIEVVQFKSTAGVPLIMIVKAGKRKAEFDGFVGELQSQIKTIAEKRANQALLPTPTAVTPAATHPSRQP